MEKEPTKQTESLRLSGKVPTILHPYVGHSSYTQPTLPWIGPPVQHLAIIPICSNVLERKVNATMHLTNECHPPGSRGVEPKQMKERADWH
jgi:hypothetical protein